MRELRFITFLKNADRPRAAELRMQYLHNMAKDLSSLPKVLEGYQANDSQACIDRREQVLVETPVRNGKLNFNFIAKDVERFAVESCSKHEHFQVHG